MGRLLYELGLLDERKRLANERESNKMGKGSFTWAWEMDATAEERSRCDHSYLLSTCSDVLFSGVSRWILRNNL